MPGRRRRPRSAPVPARRRTLKELIDRLPAPDIQRGDLKALVLQLVMDTPDDLPAAERTPRLKVRLDALRLLADIIRDEGETDTAGELLSLLAPSPPDTE